MVGINLVKSFLFQETHQDVINLIETTIKTKILSNFLILRNKKSTIYIPRNLKGTVPALCAHTDTVFNIKPTKETIKTEKGIITSLSKSHGIGADDRAGCYIISQVMINNPSDFIFCLFDEEETGCRGSNDFQKEAIKDYVKIWIGFDRKGNSDVATYNQNNKKLVKMMKKNYFIGFKKQWGSTTDVAILSRATNIACLNFSIGYYSEHTPSEKLVLKELQNTFSVIEPLANLEDDKYPVNDKYVYSYTPSKTTKNNTKNKNYDDYYDYYDDFGYGANLKHIVRMPTTYYCSTCKREFFPGERAFSRCCGNVMERIEGISI